MRPQVSPMMRPGLGRAGERDDRHVRDARPAPRRPSRRGRARAGSTSGGSPASSRISTSRCTVCGTSSAGLKMHRVPAQQRGKHLPRRDRQREVERRDEARRRRSAGGSSSPTCPRSSRRHGVAEEPPALGRGVVRGVDPLLHVAPRLGEHLAHLARHGVGDLFLALDQEVADAAEHVAARRRRRAAPQREAALGRARPPRSTSRGVGVGKAPDQVGGVRRDCGSRSRRRWRAPPTRRR